MKELTMKRIIVLLTLCLTLLGCFSSGNKQIMDASKTSQIQEGKTTKAEIIAVLGEPNHTTSMPNGEEMWMYNYTQSVTRPTTFIPVIGLFAGGTDMKGKTLMFRFDKNGILQKTDKGQMTGGGGSIFD
jgi:outer membrane protein assembly factor BamE (lipoprotein component of BamABCDE complex)